MLLGLRTFQPLCQELLDCLEPLKNQKPMHQQQEDCKLGLLANLEDLEEPVVPGLPTLQQLYLDLADYLAN